MVLVEGILQAPSGACRLHSRQPCLYSRGLVVVSWIYSHLEFHALKKAKQKTKYREGPEAKEAFERTMNLMAMESNAGYDEALELLVEGAKKSDRECSAGGGGINEAKEDDG